MDPNSSETSLTVIKDLGVINGVESHIEIFLRIIFIFNILVTFFVGSVSLFATDKAPLLVFQQVYQKNDVMRIVGSFWLAIGIASILGLVSPLKFSPVLIIQIIYKGLYLLVQVLPKLIKKEPVPIGMSVFFLIWVLVLPFIVPWKYLLR